MINANTPKLSYNPELEKNKKDWKCYQMTKYMARVIEEWQVVTHSWGKDKNRKQIQSVAMRLCIVSCFSLFLFPLLSRHFQYPPSLQSSSFGNTPRSTAPSHPLAYPPTRYWQHFASPRLSRLLLSPVCWSRTPLQRLLSHKKQSCKHIIKWGRGHKTSIISG